MRAAAAGLVEAAVLAASPTPPPATTDELATLALLRRAKDMIDRDYAQPLDVPTIASKAFMSPAHFSRKFRAAYGETPYSYLMTRRIERASALLRAGISVTDACMAVGATSLGSFSSRFTEIMGETPSSYKSRDHSAIEALPPCFIKVATRPARSGPRTSASPGSEPAENSSRNKEARPPATT